VRFVLVELSPSGGLFQFSFQLGRELATQGHSVELVTGPDPELRSTTPGFRVLPSLPTWHVGAGSLEGTLRHRARRVARGLRHLVSLALVLAHVGRSRPDVLLWHPLRFPIDSWAVVLTRRLFPDVVTAVVLHEPRPLSEQRRSGSFYKTGTLVQRSFAAALARMDVLFVLGERTRQVVREHWSTPAAVEVIPHGDEDVFLHQDELPPADRTPPRVLFFGTWTRHKGIDVLLDALPLVRRRVPDAELVLAGAAGDVDLGALRRRAQSLQGVDLRPGYVPMAEVPELLSTARVVAVPYLRANQSGVVHLAQTFARPVVASTVGDIPAAVSDGATGLLVPPGDAGALADALSTLLEDPHAAARMGRAGRDRVTAEGGWPEIATKVADAAGRARSRRSR